MNPVSKPTRLLLISPWFLLLFLVVPAALILDLTLHLRLPLINPRLMLANNICFAVLLGCRVLWYLSRVGKAIRYDEGARRTGTAYDCGMPADKARGILSGRGYSFAASGRYGERREAGYLGAVLLYLGLFLVVGTGCYDNLKQFAGVLLDGVGPSTELSKPESYRSLSMGPLSSQGKDLPQMKILSQTLPDSTYPMGATEIALFPKKGEPQSTVLMPKEPFRYGPYDIFMSKLVFQPEIVIKTKDGRVLFDDLVRLDPLVQKRGEFSFYGIYNGAQVVGGVYYQPEKDLLMLVVTRNGKRLVADMTFQVDQQVTVDNYVISCARMGQWSEIHVVRHRHMALLWLGGILAALGLLVRVVVRPQRVWLEETESGCRVFSVGEESLKLLKAQ